MSIVHDSQSNPRLVTFRCDNCEKKFERGTKTKPKLDYRLLKREEHFCSSKCAYQGRKPTKAKALKCDCCGTSISKPPCRIKETNFCSQKCYWKYRKTDPRVKAPRKPCSEETKRKISQANKGRQSRLGAKLSRKTKAKIAAKARKRLSDPTKNPMYGRSHTVEAREAMSKAHTKAIMDGRKSGYGNGHVVGYFSSSKAGTTYFYRSKWELACMKWLDENEQVQTYLYEGVRLKYIDVDKNRSYTRYYVPDFLITFTDGHRELWEIKPRAFWNNRRTKLKADAANKYCLLESIERYRLLGKPDLQELGAM